MTRSSTLLVLSVSGLLAAFGVGCGENPPAQDPSAKTTYETAQNPAPTSPFETGTGLPHSDAPATPPKEEETAPAPAPAPVAEPLTDAHILEVVRTASSGEVEQGKLAKTKAKDARVKKFADLMVKDHSEANAKSDALAKKNNIEPKSSTHSTSLASDAKDQTTAMSSQTGTEFDKAYIDGQVKAHQAVLDTIEGKLLPAAQNAEVKTLLEGVRGKVTRHLAEAKEIQKHLTK